MKRSTAIVTGWCLLTLVAGLAPATGADRPAFDRSRAQMLDSTLFQPFDVTTTYPLSELATPDIDEVDDSELLLIMMHPAGELAFFTRQLAYHHIAQGDLNGQPWLVSFCRVCNSGACFDPTVNGRVLHFRVIGLYHGLPILTDAETHSLWDHITGECLDGPLKGESLPSYNLLHLTVAQARRTKPELRVAVSDHRLEPPVFSPHAANPKLRSTFLHYMGTSLGPVDNRRDTLDLGLGLWTDRAARYYPLDQLESHGGWLCDTLDGRPLLAFLDPVSHVPGALWLEAKSVIPGDAEFILDRGRVIRDGQLFSADGNPLPVERPLQMFTRWYGFAATFPDCSVFLLIGNSP